jgi:hypothetical protein
MPAPVLLIPTLPLMAAVPVIDVWPKTEKLAAAPSPGSVAAAAAIGPARKNARETAIAAIIEFLLLFFIEYILYLVY